MKLRILFLSFIISYSTLIINICNGQVDSSWQDKPEIFISVFADVFYIFDFNRPPGSERQPFLYNHNRHNEFNLNLGIVKFEIAQTKFRSNLALQAGTYANDNYASEPGLLKNIFEANIGISLNRKNNLWLDAGILPSHIGFENAISMNNWTLTRSILAENSPYFLSGAKITYNPNDKWELAGLIINGWQRIQRLQGNSIPSFGAQVNFSPSDKVMLNWSTFLGTDDPDSIRRLRFFNNLYGQFQITEKFGFITGLDFGIQQRFKGSSDYNPWISPVFIGKYSISEEWKIGLRAEYYQDDSGIIIPTNTINGFQTTGLSINFDYSPIQNILCRIEARWLNSKDRIFETQNASGNSNFIIGASMAVTFRQKMSK